MLIAGDHELLVIVGCSLKVSGLATKFFSQAYHWLPYCLHEFSRQTPHLDSLNTLLALPTVVIGLATHCFPVGILGARSVVYPEGDNYRPDYFIPVIATMTIAAISRIDKRYRTTALTLGANRCQMAWVIFIEARYGIIAAVIAAFGRVIAEIGISMMLGGNAKGFTRTMTTAMALEYDKGEFVLAVALGIILMGLAFAINLLFHLFQGRLGSDAV
jgi:tungstate transport system permease protein